jgi:serine/threonine-protein kinase
VSSSISGDRPSNSQHASGANGDGELASRKTASSVRSVHDSAPESDRVESEEELSPGSQVGNYVVRACIGRGAMASVYRAEHCLLNKHVALKVMARSLHGSAEARQRFLREARAVAAIQHPNVVAIADAGLIDGVPYLVMELLEGQDLEQHLERHGPLSAQELAALALPLVAALAAAHDAGVIHRDLKPGNIFLARGAGGELVPKLLDFGISKFASPDGAANLAVTAFDQLMGSPLYLPPESLQGSRELTPRSDQYSLGVVLYECITGQAPFFREDLLPLLNAISEGSCAAPRSLRPDLPEALDDAILRAMSVDPRRRFEHIRELGRALLGLADLRTRHIWAPAFAPGGRIEGSAIEGSSIGGSGSGGSGSGGSGSGGSGIEGSRIAGSAIDLGGIPCGSAVVVRSGARAAAGDAVPVRVRSVRRAAVADSARRRPLWGALLLLVAGGALLGLAFGRMRGAGVVATPLVSAQAEPRLELAEPALALLAAPSVRPWPGAPGAREPAAGAEPPLGSRAVASARSLGVRAASPPRPASGEPGPGPRAVSQRGRGSDSDSDLGKLFFSAPAAARGAAAPQGKAAGPRRGRTAPALEPAPVLVNEAPLFD